ncbi:prephenate dehydrogenase [Sharpea azabuensis]|uniref:Prephenate dehydrogenase n=1 Tax=Sharpea porci TaxID=2652286 RepID=A0A844FRP6_9FIRM|nr:prephenate dehydrogenase [Sharpea porci]MDD6710562.1 prephenate dehydrogenase [Sharpea porci]MDY5278597.1 prephenate dehydrogenase [Sharpea porci]MST88315.1 prephenate dehydrogenase [Sharpea porci]
MKITVVGLGVIGGSFVKALKGKGYEVYGVDKDVDTLNRAKEDGCIIEGFVDGEEIIPETDLTIICLYPSLVLDFIKNAHFKSGSVVSDAVGIKSYFIEQALEMIPDDVEYISVHPMAGREKKGYAYASADVFKNANFIIIQHETNDEQKIKKMQLLAGKLGFRSVKIMSPYEHDEIISYTSQLPHVMAVALMNSDTQKYDTGKYIGDSFRDLTRIANINEDLWTELFLNNKRYLLSSIRHFEKQLDIMKKAIYDDDDETLKECFRESTRRREHL